MSAGAFTPGPWEASLEAVRFVIQHVPEHGMGKRALAYTGGAEPVNPFNAYLIAAAPEQHQALAMSTAQLMSAADALKSAGKHRAAASCLSQCDFNRSIIAKALGK